MSWAVTVVVPAWPVATATLVKLLVTFASVQVYVSDAPAPIEARPGMSAFVRAQPGASASVTTTSVRVEVPSFVTVIVNVAVWPSRIVC